LKGLFSEPRFSKATITKFERVGKSDPFGEKPTAAVEATI